MSAITFVLLALAVFVLGCGGLILRAFFRVRGEPVVIPPEGRQPIAIPALAPPAQASAAGPSDARPAPPLGTGALDGSRSQPFAAPPLDRQSVATLKRWYTGRECAVCHREIGPVYATEPRPGLLNVAAPSREILRWDDIPADHLQAVLDSHLPVCASCNLAESFRREFPERVTDRTDSAQRDRAYH
jgi:hypothetical protein